MALGIFGSRALGRITTRLRFPQLFVLAATLFVVDLVIPDMLPFVDEILLGLLTALLAALREKVPDAAGPRDVKNVTPPGARR